MNEPTRTVQAVETACELLDLLQEREGAGVTTLADELGIAKSAVHTHLATLLSHNYVAKEGTEYKLSLRYLEMAEYVKDQFDIYDIVRREIDSLSEKTGELAHFGTEERNQLVHVYRSHGSQAIELGSQPGARDDLHCTGLGKSILANLSIERQDEIIETQGLPQRTAQTITSRNALTDELEAIREQGYAVDDEECISGLRCVSAPVISADETVIGAVSVSGPASRIIDELFEERLPNHVNRSSNVIELNIRYS